jgi:AraC family transcriptional regulator, transcriptional activator of pobA
MKILPVLHIEQFPANEREDFYVNDFASHVKSHYERITPPHKHDFYLTVLFTQGSGIHEVDFHPYEINAGSIFMLKPGQTHYWKFSSDTNGYILFHTRAFYDLVYSNKTVDSFPFFYSYQNSPHLYIEGEQMLEIETLFRKILKEYCSEKLLRFQKISSLLDILYIELSRLYVHEDLTILKGTPGMYLEKIKQLDLLIEKNFLIKKSASEYAEMMHMSTRHLNRIVQSVLGKTTTELITERVLLEAQRMLSHSRVTVTEVAEFLGYDDSAYFSRIFKKKLHISPTEFANKYQ